jgi:hypothetical protein
MSLSFQRLAAPCLMILVACSCGGETKPSSPDAKVPEKSPSTPTPEMEAIAQGKVKVIDGPNPTEDRYELKIEPADAKAGQEGTVMVKVVPKSPWHMNLDFPTTLAVTAPTDVKLSKGDQNKADALKLDENSAEFAVKFTATAAGDKEFGGKFKFAVCQDEACSPVTEELKFRVAVK